MQSIALSPTSYSITYRASGAHAVTDLALTLTGTGFDFASPVQFTSGTVTSVSYRAVTTFYSLDGTTVTTTGGGERFDGISLSAIDFMNAYLASDWAAVNALLMPDDVVFTGLGLGDTFAGGAVNDALMGFGGNDDLTGNGGDDYINGGAGDDQLKGGTGADLIYGDLGLDTVSGGDGSDILLLGDGNDNAMGDAGADVLYGEGGDDQLGGGGDNDALSGGDANDYLMGEGGDDRLYGDAGDDVLVDSAGADVLSGGDGIDALFLGLGNDYAIGGAGIDYVYAMPDGPEAGAHDIIQDFAAASTGTPDYLVLPSVVQSATTIFDAGGYTWVATTTIGATHYIALIGTSADTVAAQTLWL